MRPSDFAERVVAYCTATHSSVTSWGRTDRHNADVGGVSGSLHRAFLAVDVVYDRPLPLESRTRYASALGLDLVAEGDHDHLQAGER